jgi:hypothetical protein
MKTNTICLLATTNDGIHIANHDDVDLCHNFITVANDMMLFTTLTMLAELDGMEGIYIFAEKPYADKINERFNISGYENHNWE